jgi:mannose-6-phosphate isomerase-like protein (cupin superfamily)
MTRIHRFSSGPSLRFGSGNAHSPHGVLLPRISPSQTDFDNLSRLKTETVGDTCSWSSVVVNKPWGYEYLWYENANAALWMLYLEQDKATSLHAHIRKRTALIVVEGCVVCSTLENRYALTCGQGIILEPSVFHSTKAVSPKGSFVLEVETPPLKHDLVRLRDSFGRAGTGYEGQSQYSENLADYAYAPLLQEPSRAQVFRALGFALHSIGHRHDLENLLLTDPSLLIFLGQIQGDSGIIADTAEAFRSLHRDCSIFPQEFPPIEVLAVQRGT